MRVRSLSAATVVAFSCLVFAACSTETAPTDPAAQAERQDPKGNPFKDTALDAQGEALKKARNLGDEMNKAAEQRRDDIDAQSE